MKRGDMFIIALVVIAFAILIGGFLMGTVFSIKDSHIDILSNDTLKDGDHFQIKLSDADGNPIANESVKIVIMDSHGKRQAYNVVTDSNGLAQSVIGNKDPGKVSVNASFEGNDKFNSTSAVKRITVVEGTSVNSTNTSSSATQVSSSAGDSSYSSSSYDSSSEGSSYSDSSYYSSDADSGYSDYSYDSSSDGSGYESYSDSSVEYY